MSNPVFNMDIMNELLMESVDQEEFAEFCFAIDFLDGFGTPRAFLEEVIDEPHGVRKRTAEVIRNTKKTTKDVGGAYIKIVDANGGLIKASWDLFIKFLNIAVKAITFILKFITKIPKSILVLVNKIGKIPSQIRNKIKGNISLYITVNDLNLLYNNSLLYRVDTFMSTLEQLSKGEWWSSQFKRHAIEKSSTGVVPKMLVSDMKLCRKLEAISNKIENIRFEPTTIEMSDEKVVNTYFGNEKCIEFVDLKGNRHNATFLDALSTLIEDITKQKDVLEGLQKDFGDKYARTQENSTFSDMSSMKQNRIVATVSHISKVISIVGNVMRYVTTDINTMNRTIDKINRHNK